MLEPYLRDYQRLIIQDRVAADMVIKGGLQIYSFAQGKSDVTVGCTGNLS